MQWSSILAVCLVAAVSGIWFSFSHTFFVLYDTHMECHHLPVHWVALLPC